MENKVLTALVILLIIINFISVVAYLVKRSDCKSLHNRMSNLIPHRVGSRYKNDNGEEYIFVSFDAELSPINGGNPVTVYQILERFFNTPSDLLDSFYVPGNTFGISIPIVRPTVLPHSNKFAFIVKDLSGEEYTLAMKNLPKYYKIEIQQYGED